MDEIVLSKEEMFDMLRMVRAIAWIGYADGRNEYDYKQALYDILKETREVGNDYMH
jgi:hypothetical protein